MSPRRAAASILGLALALALAACEDKAEPAPEITIARAEAAATLDPALAADRDTLEAIWLSQTPLLTYRHVEGEAGTELIPGLASDLPEISADGRTYTLTLRKDLTYSDGAPAVASDFERAVERDLALDSPAKPYLREIADIDSDDASGEISISLTKPDATFAYVLATPATAPVPAGTPRRDLGAEPPPGIGPYELSAGPGGGLVLSRSESFEEFDIPDIPRGNVATITVRVVADAVERTTLVLNGEIDSIQGPPATALESEIAADAGDRYAQSPASSTTYAFLDRSREPFDDPAVREAVAAAVDSSGCSLIPPGMPGYDHDFDTTGCAPDLAAARALIRQAGAERAPVTVGNPGHARTAQYVRELRAVGLDARAGGQSGGDTEVITRFATMPQPFEFFERVADEPLVAAKLDALRMQPESVTGWTGLERYVLFAPQTYLVSLGHERATTLFSERMDPEIAVVHPLFGNDFATWRVAEGK